jgi:lipopolysaccharide export system protein LptA
MWRRRLRLVIALFGVGVLAAVVYLLRPRDVRTGLAPIERLDPTATVETRGGDVIQLKGATKDLQVEFERQVSYSDGQTRLMGVTLTVDNRGGRTFVVKGAEARVGSDPVSYNLKGDVRLEASDGLVATAGEASYAEAEGIVRAPGPVQFSRGRMSGAGIGFAYDEQRDTVWLLDQAVVRFAADGAAGPMDVASGAAGFARRERYVRFERGVRMLRDGQVIEADEATVFLFPDRDEPDHIELRGNASVTGGTGLGVLRAMRARDINLDYRDDGRTLQQAMLAGDSVIQMANPDGSEGQRLSGAWIDVALAEDGSVTSLSSRERVTVVLPGAAGSPPRTIQAGDLSASGAAGAGITAMRFQDGVTFREEASGGGAARTARARTLTTRLAGGSGALEEADFAGGFRFEEGPLTAGSAEARYRIGPGLLNLTGREGVTPPHVSDETLRIDADTIDLTLAPRRMAAEGSVKCTLQPSGKSGSAQAGRRPALLGDSEPVIVVSTKMTYDESTRRGDYIGQARLFQGDTTILADRITMDEARGDLVATGKVRTTLALTAEKPDPATAPVTAAPRTTIVVASSFRYTDEARLALYETTPKEPQARMNGQQGDLTADRIELTLAKSENALERLQAGGTVRAIVGKRTATGARLTYEPTEEQYVITGTPVRFVDECNESAGKTLTFFRSSDRVIIDGNEEVRTETRGGKCKGGSS